MLIFAVSSLLAAVILYIFSVTPYRWGIYGPHQTYIHSTNFLQTLPTISTGDYRTMILTRSFLTDIYLLLSKTHREFGKLNIPYTLGGPCLLGQYCLGTVLPWCGLLDIYCNLSHEPMFYHKNLIRSCARTGLHFFTRNSDKTILYLSTNNLFGPMIRIHFGKQTDYNFVLPEKDKIPIQYLYPLQTARIGPIICSIPNNPRKVLKVLFPDFTPSTLLSQGSFLTGALRPLLISRRDVGK